MNASDQHLLPPFSESWKADAAWFVRHKDDPDVTDAEVALAHQVVSLVEQLEAARGELETTRADLYQCKREREILSRNLSALTGNA